MERLTKRVCYDGEYMYGSIGIACDDEQYLEKVYNKLGRLEDLEEELGIDLITLEKALKEGVYTIHSNGERRIPCLAYNGAVGYILDFKYEQEAQYILSDYGKTWWLEKPKEELENE